MIEMSTQTIRGKTHEIVDRRARHTICSILGDTVTLYDLTSELHRITSSNDVFLVAAGKSYTTTLVPDKGYVIGTVSVLMGGVNITSSVYAGGVIRISNVTGPVTITAIALIGDGTLYGIYYDLINCEIDNRDTSVEMGAAYTATLTPVAGYAINSVTVTMGGTDITSSVYDETNGEISIESVTGDIVITATASAVQYYTITRNLTNVTDIGASANSHIILHGDKFDAFMSTEEGYRLDSVTVTMGGVDITETAVNEMIVTIESVTGDIVLTATAVSAPTYPVTRNLTNVTDTFASDTIATHGEHFMVALKPVNGYEITSVSITMGGVDVTEESHAGDYVYGISNVSGDIVITAMATAIAGIYTVTRTLFDAETSNLSDTVSHGSAYTAIITANEGYAFSSGTATFSIKMGDEYIFTDDVVTFSEDLKSATISIPSVTGNLVITIRAMAI